MIHHRGPRVKSNLSISLTERIGYADGLILVRRKERGRLRLQVQLGDLPLDVFQHVAVQRKGQFAKWAGDGCSLHHISDRILGLATANRAGERKLVLSHGGASLEGADFVFRKGC
jgi:hypothetical protein